jgi:hypothetical protein
MHSRLSIINTIGFGDRSLITVLFMSSLVEEMFNMTPIILVGMVDEPI